jgi:hypothetical protein
MSENKQPEQDGTGRRLFQEEGFNVKYSLAPRTLVPLFKEPQAGAVPETPAPKAPKGSAGQAKREE